MHILTRNHRSRGFTLIEMSMVIVILGMAAAGVSQLAGLYFKNQDFKRTETNIHVISSAIGNFRSLHGRYPCPASITEERSDIEYGRENCGDLSSTAPGSCIDGICVEESLRTMTYLNQFTREFVTGKPRVRVGFIPFRQLNLDEEEVYDSYGNKIMYVVTEHLMNFASFKPNQGGIEIWNEEEKSLLSESASAHFLAFSYGPNGAGGYTIEGTRFPCPVDGYEHENCNQETDSVYQIAAFSTESHLPFDDVFSYSTQDEIPLWKLSEDPGHTMDIHQIPLGNVGIFTAPTTPLQAEGHIQGVLRAQDDPVSGAAEGMAMATQICMENGAECFPSSAIAGQLAESEGMECPPGEFISAIKNAAPVCIPEVIISCPAGEFATGLTDDGTLLCTGSTPTGPTTCPAQTVDVCGKLVNIPAGNEGDIYKAGTPMTIDATTSATIQTYKTYVCSSGSWVYSPSPTDGTCTCTTGSTTAIVPCGPGYSGSKSQTYNAACPSYTSTYTINAVACACKQETETKHEDCPPGYTGSGITMARDHLCPSVSPVAIPTWTDWYQIDASTDCTCTPDSKDVVKACPNGESGEIHEKWVLECPSGAWTFYSEISNTCVGCVDTTEIRTNTCPAGETGVIEEEWAYSCATDTWTLVQETSNTCTIPVCHWTPISTPQGPYPHPSGSLEYSKCTCGAPDEQCYRHAGTQYEHFPACQCQ